jgi:hypothetical protein
MATTNRIEITALWSIGLSILLTVLQTAVANAGPLFDENRRVILPSESATTILKWYLDDRLWSTTEWSISAENLESLEVVLASALAKGGFRHYSIPSFYRQYMPAEWKGLHIIVVNGFYESASDLFPDKGIDPDKWKHDLLTIFGGGCGFWRAIFVVDQNRLMILQPHNQQATVLCNAPK